MEVKEMTRVVLILCGRFALRNSALMPVHISELQQSTNQDIVTAKSEIIGKKAVDTNISQEFITF